MPKFRGTRRKKRERKRSRRQVSILIAHLALAASRYAERERSKTTFGCRIVKTSTITRNGASSKRWCRRGRRRRGQEVGEGLFQRRRRRSQEYSSGERVHLSGHFCFSDFLRFFTIFSIFCLDPAEGAAGARLPLLLHLLAQLPGNVLQAPRRKEHRESGSEVHSVSWNMVLTLDFVLFFLRCSLSLSC